MLTLIQTNLWRSQHKLKLLWWIKIKLNLYIKVTAKFRSSCLVPFHTIISFYALETRVCGFLLRYFLMRKNYLYNKCPGLDVIIWHHIWIDFILNVAIIIMNQFLFSILRIWGKCVFSLAFQSTYLKYQDHILRGPII